MEYFYGMMNRPGEGCTLPEGYQGIQDDILLDEFRHGIVVYRRELTDKELDQWELVHVDPEFWRIRASVVLENMMPKAAKWCALPSDILREEIEQRAHSDKYSEKIRPSSIQLFVDYVYDALTKSVESKENDNEQVFSFRLNVDDLGRFVTVVNKLNKRSVKCSGHEAISFTKGAPFDHTVKVKMYDHRGEFTGQESRAYRLLPIEVKVNREHLVVAGGWRVVARIQRDDATHIPLVFLDDKSPDVYAKLGMKEGTDSMPSMDCDHCHANRLRNLCFLLRSTEGELRQVGSTCLSSFLDKEAAERWITMHEILDFMEEIEKDTREESDGGIFNPFYNGIPHYDVREVVGIAIGLMQSGVDPGELKEAVKAILTDKRRDKSAFTDAEENTFGEFIAFVDTMPYSDFAANLSVITALPDCGLRSIGYLAGGVKCFLRDRQERVRAASRCHVGTIGGKIEVAAELFEVRTIKGYRRETPTFVHTFLTHDDNILTWMTSRQWGEEGELYLLSGAVKNHDEYRGAKQTQITRCKLAALPIIPDEGELACS